MSVRCDIVPSRQASFNLQRLFLLTYLFQCLDSFYSRSAASMSVKWIGRYLRETVPDSGGAEEQYGWVPLVCLVVTQLGAAIGIQNIPFILSSEYFPTSIRPQVNQIFFNLNCLANEYSSFILIDNGLSFLPIMIFFGLIFRCFFFFYIYRETLCHKYSTTNA